MLSCWIIELLPMVGTQQSFIWSHQSDILIIDYHCDDAYTPLSTTNAIPPHPLLHLIGH